MYKGCEGILPQGKGLYNSQKFRKLEEIYKTNRLILSKKSLSLKTRGSQKVPYSKSSCCKLIFFNSSVIRQKGEISKQVFQDNKIRQIFRKTNISYPLITCAYQGVRNVRFSKNLTCFVFLKHPFLESLFCLITYKLTILHVTCSKFRYHFE